ncbi:MAG TPA: T9SS type A sorting domain-containing protein, partial [Candidatus Marinimicrobia bacterium]|nr:T9SS type A sorting domain-containing protein [Candidatus Neomarinimicrobiota bacterium]
NRNYSYIDDNGNEVWNTSGTSSNQNGNTYAGDGPFSESENKAIRYFVENHDFILALNNHTHSNLLLYPYGYDYNQYTEDNDVYEFLSEELVKENGYDNIISADLYPAAGDSDDFMYGMLETESGGSRNKIFAMTPEIGSSFWPAASTIEDLCKEMMYLNLTAAQMVNNYATLKDITTSNFISSSSYSTSYEIQRLGIGGQGDFDVSITPISDNIISGTNTNSHNQMSLGGIIGGAFTIELSSEIQYGDQVSYMLVLNNGSFNKEYIINKIYGDPIIVFEDESSMIQDYWESDSWNITYEDYTSPDTSITDSPNGNYSNNEYSVIELSNSVNLSDASYAELSFNAKWHTESGYDYIQVEISTDNGQSWIPQCGKYTKIGSDTHENAIDEPLYDGLQESWVNETISLSDYLNNEIKIRFKLVSDNSQRRDGFYFDDLKINIISSNLSINSIDNIPVQFYPNPAEEKVFINTTLTNYNITIYNILGKQIFRTIGNSGNTTINLSSLPHGIFLLKLNNGKKIKTFKIIKN